MVGLLWKKALAEVELGGLTPREAAKVALNLKDFQEMPDPLLKYVKVSTVHIKWTLYLYVGHVKHNVHFNIDVFQLEEQVDEDSKSWFALGDMCGLDIVEDEVVGQDEDDKEVERIIAAGKETKRKIIRSMYACTVC